MHFGRCYPTDEIAAAAALMKWNYDGSAGADLVYFFIFHLLASGDAIVLPLHSSWQI
jgi:hypothetical protein